MIDEIIQNKRIRESAPHRRSMSMSDEDLKRANELEELFSKIYPDERPFSFSKTISKALEIASKALEKRGPVEKQELSQKQALISVEPEKLPEKSKVPKMFRNGRKH